MQHHDADEVLDLIKEANQRDITLFLEDGKLKYKTVRKQSVDPVFLGRIKKYKDEISQLLGGHDRPAVKIDWAGIVSERMRTERVPLSFAQERLWFLDQLSGSRHYHIPSVLLLQGPLRADLLQEAFRLLLERHQPLRTRIEHHQGRPCQHLLAARHWQLHLPAASHLAAGSPLLQARIDALIDQPFELSRDYPLRASLLQLQPRQHVLVLTLHHIAADGWSWSILTSELSLLYQALLEGQDPQLPQLPLQYADFALWQRSPAHQHQLEQDLSYWQQKLHALAPQQLPADFARPARAATRASSVQASLPADLHQALLAYCHQQGASLFMGLLAALKALLFRYCQQQDLCVGSPIAGRELAQTQSLVGLFVNTLALRTQLHGQMSFEQLLQAVKTTTLQAYHHQQAPFEQVVQRLAPHRQAGHNPLFQLMLALQNTPSAPGLQLAGLQASPLPLPQGPAKFDLLLTCWQAEGGSLDCRLEYCPGLFAAGRMQALLVHFRQLLEALLQAPHSPLCRLPMLTPREQQVLAGLSVNPTPYPSQLTLVDLFARQLHQRPHQPALVSPHQPPLSYQQLDARSNQLAHLLLARGLQAEQAVGLCLERGNELIVSLLAVLKAGGAYLPLDPSYPTARLGHMLEKAAWPLVVTCPASRGSLPPDYPGPVLCLQAHQPLISRQPTLPPPIVLRPEQLAYVLFTSGSTGKPKGVLIEHRNVVSLVAGVSTIQLGPSDVVLSTGSPSFDASTYEYWGTLLNGGTLVLCPEADLLDPQLLKAEMVRRRVTAAWFTSSWLNQLIDTDLTLFETLRMVVAGGEKLSEHHIGKLHRAYPALAIINGYGPTENTTFSTTCRITPEHLAAGIPIGRPLENREVWVLGEAGELVPAGVPGEVWVGGAGLGRGYLHEPQLTQDRFLDHPFRQGQRLYRTGDLGRWLPDGNLAFLGRSDQQVKVRGYRIELGEIEHLIQQSGLVQQGVVLAPQAPDGNRQLVGYLVAHKAFEVGPLVAFLAAHLPAYLVPSRWRVVERLPLTANGKVDKKALVEAQGASPVGSQDYQPPGTDLEQGLVEAWQQVLGCERVGVQDNFFALGGHSLLVLQVIGHIRALGYPVRFGDLFTYQTIAQLAGHLEASRPAAATPAGTRPVATNPASPYVQLLHDGNPAVAVFILPGAPGLVDGYEALARSLGDACTVYGLRMVGLAEGETPLPGIPEMGRWAAARIKETQPAGPYRFIGHSIGAHVAFETTRQLEQEGQQVEWLAVLDAAVDPGSAAKERAGRTADEALAGMAGLFLHEYGLIPSPHPEWLDEMRAGSALLPREEKAAFLIDFIRSHVRPPDPLAFALRALSVMLTQALVEYRPAGRTGARVLVVKAAEATWTGYDECLGWRPHAPRIEAVAASGDHLTLVRDANARALGEHLRAHLLPRPADAPPG